MSTGSEAWNEFLNQVRGARASLSFHEGEECWYRGHGNGNNWKLLPLLFRDARTEDQLEKLEYDLFYEFQALARELHAQSVSDWDILFYMRHHAVPTRLLDWTEVLGVAVYFALRELETLREKRVSLALHAALGKCVSSRDEFQRFARQGIAELAPCVWILNPYLLNEIHDYDRDLWSPKMLGWDGKQYDDYGELLLTNGIKWEFPVAIYPAQKSARMSAQRAGFTIHGSQRSPLEHDCKDAVRKVNIPVDAIDAAREYLALSGIDEHVLFPDLDGLSRYLRSKHRFDSWATLA